VSREGSWIMGLSLTLYSVESRNPAQIWGILFEGHLVQWHFVHFLCCPNDRACHTALHSVAFFSERKEPRCPPPRPFASANVLYGRPLYCKVHPAICRAASDDSLWFSE
jgi:hypothetical protein